MVSTHSSHGRNMGSTPQAFLLSFKFKQAGKLGKQVQKENFIIHGPLKKCCHDSWHLSYILNTLS